MSLPKNESEKVVPKTISLPEDIWKLIGNQAGKWRTSNSAAVLRMILEWEENRSTCQIQEGEPITMIAA